ncbi:hypothetical protein B0H19DRAFT_717082 [Mycena capillaripes]|nr:hypothetical protein B0H19DRAFT_717082 [Mycena capillaripes]
MTPEEEDDGVGGRLAGSSIGGGVVTPFPAAAGHQYYADPHTAGQQHAYYGGAAGGYDGASMSERSPTASYYPGSSSHAGGGPMSATSAGSSSHYTNPMSAKEREARGGGLAVANPGPYGHPMHMPMPAPGVMSPGVGPLPNPHSPGSQQSGGSAHGSGVLVHTDGGRVPDQSAGEGMREIPPTYDSIRS